MRKILLTAAAIAPLLLGGCSVSSFFHQLAERRAITRSLGDMPPECETGRGKLLSENTISRDGDGVIKRVAIDSCGNTVTAYVAVPPVTRPDTPVVIALHQTTNAGKDEVMGLGGDKNLAYGRTFLRDGYIVVAPDVFTAGENYDPQRGWDTAEFYKKYPEWSAMGRMLQDNLAVATYAHRTFPGRCMAAVGHSLGGHNALFLAAFDKDIKVAVSSAGFESIALDPLAERWARSSFFVYMPELRPTVAAHVPRKVPWDFDDVLNQITPRKVLVLQGERDTEWNVASVRAMVNEANQDAGGRKPVTMLLHDGGHEFGPSLQAIAVRFVGKACGLPGDTDPIPAKMVNAD